MKEWHRSGGPDRTVQLLEWAKAAAEPEAGRKTRGGKPKRRGAGTEAAAGTARRTTEAAAETPKQKTGVVAGAEHVGAGGALLILAADPKGGQGRTETARRRLETRIAELGRCAGVEALQPVALPVPAEAAEQARDTLKNEGGAWKAGGEITDAENPPRREVRGVVWNPGHRGHLEPATAGVSVLAYVTEEVARQGHRILEEEGQVRVAWMLQAWEEARRTAHGPAGEKRAITPAAVAAAGRRIEPWKNRWTWRNVPVAIAGEYRAQNRNTIGKQIAELCERQEELDPLAWYRELEQIHPFGDGNGRTGKVMLAWLDGLWERPRFPPNDFWGWPIRNP